MIDLHYTLSFLGIDPVHKNTNNNWLYLCPFHNDTVPSFSANSEVYNCFACGAKGNHKTLIPNLSITLKPKEYSSYLKGAGDYTVRWCGNEVYHPTKTITPAQKEYNIQKQIKDIIYSGILQPYSSHTFSPYLEKKCLHENIEMIIKSTLFWQKEFAGTGGGLPLYLAKHNDHGFVIFKDDIILLFDNATGYQVLNSQSKKFGRGSILKNSKVTLRGNPTLPIYVCEGLADGLTIKYLAPDNTVIICLCSENMGNYLARIEVNPDNYIPVVDNDPAGQKTLENFSGKNIIDFKKEPNKFDINDFYIKYGYNKAKEYLMAF